MKRLIIGIMFLFLLAGCSPTQKAPSTEELDLSLVSKYVFSFEEYSENAISVENPDDIQKVNGFLGQTVVITHYEDPCPCDYLDTVMISLTSGKELFFGIEKNASGSFDFSNYSLSVIRFEGKSYDDLIDLVKGLDDGPDVSAPTELTVDEALELHNAWFDNREDSPEPLNRETVELYEFDGARYYLFRAEEPSMYWYNILVHTETGKLLFMMTPDGEDPVTMIQPFDDYYENGFNADTAVEVA